MSHNNRSTQRLWRKSTDMWQIAINQDELITRNISNIGPEGLAFKAPAKTQFQKGQTVNIQFQLSPERSFDIQGQVMWSRDNQFGLKFSKIPMILDSFIMSSIHELALSGDAGSSITSEFRNVQRAHEKKDILSSAMALFIVAIMTTAFALSVFIQQKNPETKLANQYEKSFSRYLSNIGPGK